MAMTLVGVFDSTAEAREACRKLETSGIDRRAMRMTSGESAPVVSESRMPSMEQGMGAVRNFFSSLFGQDHAAETRAGHYSEAVRRGSAVVTVSVQDDEQADRVAELLEGCGAIDIDERIEQWRADGYRGHDPASKAYTRKGSSAERARIAAVAPLERERPAGWLDDGAMSPMAEHLRDDPLGAGPRAAMARPASYDGPERRRQSSAPTGMERRARH